MLLHKENASASVSVTHLIILRETHVRLNFLSSNMSYSTGCLVGWDFRVTGLLLDLQAGCSKMPVFCASGIAGQKTERWERHK